MKKCSACRGALIFPHSADCGHVACARCTAQSDLCSVCAKPVGNPIPHRVSSTGFDSDGEFEIRGEHAKGATAEDGFAYALLRMRRGAPSPITRGGAKSAGRSHLQRSAKSVWTVTDLEVEPDSAAATAAGRAARKGEGAPAAVTEPAASAPKTEPSAAVDSTQETAGPSGKSSRGRRHAGRVARTAIKKESGGGECKATPQARAEGPQGIISASVSGISITPVNGTKVPDRALELLKKFPTEARETGEKIIAGELSAADLPARQWIQAFNYVAMIIMSAAFFETENVPIFMSFEDYRTLIGLMKSTANRNGDRIDHIPSSVLLMSRYSLDLFVAFAQFAPTAWVRHTIRGLVDCREPVNYFLVEPIKYLQNTQVVNDAEFMNEIVGNIKRPVGDIARIALDNYLSQSFF